GGRQHLQPRAERHPALERDVQERGGERGRAGGSQSWSRNHLRRLSGDASVRGAGRQAAADGGRGMKKSLVETMPFRISEITEAEENGVKLMRLKGECQTANERNGN